MRIRWRHLLVGIVCDEPTNQLTRLRMLRRDNCQVAGLLKETVTRIETQVCLASLLIRPVAVVAVITEDRSDVTSKVDFVSVSRCQRDDNEKKRECGTVGA